MTDDPYRLYRLYRYFDATDIGLYVGISGDLAVRDKSHISRSKWMEFTARSTVERHPTLEVVKRAEREAIETECPIFNKAYNSTPEAKERLRAYLEAAGRLDLLPPARSRPAVKETSGPRYCLVGATLPVLISDRPAAKRAPIGCWDENGERPWVPGWVGWPEAHDDCPPGACLGRTIPAAVNARLIALRDAGESIAGEELRRLRTETAQAVRSMTGDEARRLITAAAADLREKG